MSSGWSPFQEATTKLGTLVERIRAGTQENGLLTLATVLTDTHRGMQAELDRIDGDAEKRYEKSKAAAKRLDAADANLQSQVDGALALISDHDNDLEALRRMIATQAAEIATLRDQVTVLRAIGVTDSAGGGGRRGVERGRQLHAIQDGVEGGVIR